ncbi:hypothetical protein B9G55_05960 [Saccharibacillus sp. O16]|nr:hypothetical protein B9G55_05960 [Saccharibacillus sp. O16]
MKWRLTARFALSSALVAVLVLILNLAVLAALFVSGSFTRYAPLHSEAVSYEERVRNFADEIFPSTSGAIDLHESGKKMLSEAGAWVQILDESGLQVYALNLPADAPQRYTPFDMIQTYKYREGESNTTVFVGKKLIQGTTYSYLIGFPYPDIARYVSVFSLAELREILKVGVLLVLVVDALVALLIAYGFGRTLTRPLYQLAERLEQLSAGHYQKAGSASGVYSEVFRNADRLAVRLQEAEQERAVLERMKDEWIGGISHDIKTPLASVLGYAEMLRNEDYEFTEAERREYAAIIEQKALYLQDVVEDLNLSVRLNNKIITLHRQTVNLVVFVREIVIDALNHPLYAGLDLDFRSDLDHAEAEIDELLMKRAVANLIENAVFHNEKQVKVVASVTQSEQGLRISVEDEGRGVPPEQADRIFERYFHGTDTGDRHRSSGLGLAIARDIARAHGGDLVWMPREPQGARFEITLPAAADSH